MMMTTTNNQGNVTVIGLGSMGTALAHALIKKKIRVTVWNRDSAKMNPLAEAGALAADTITAAINASQVIVVCVFDYKATYTILEAAGVATDLHSRTLLQLSTGTPKEARDLVTWAAQHGALCLNGDIMAWPRQMGTDEATMSVSGATATAMAMDKNGVAEPLTSSIPQNWE